MNSKTVSFIVLLAISVIIAFLFAGSADNGAEEYAEIEKLSRELNRANLELDAAVLSMQLGFVDDYDEVKRCEQLLEQYLTDKSRALRNEQFAEELLPLVKEKTTLITDFKSAHSISRIALAGFRHHSKNAFLEATRSESPYFRAIADLEILGSRFVTSGREDDASEFQAAISNAEQVAAENSQGLRTHSLEMALRHAKLLVLRRNELNHAIQSLMSVPIRRNTQHVLENAADEYAQRAKKARGFQFQLLIVIVGLLVLSVYQYTMLYKHKSALADANRHLESRVSARTTELATANQELETAKTEAEKLALVARYTDNAVLITNDRAEIEWVNEGYERITSYHAEEVIGKPFLEPQNGPDLDESQMATVKRAIERKEGFDVEMRRYRKDGTPIYMSIEARPIKNADGVISQFILIESDITDRVNADQERQKLNDQLVEASRAAGIAEVSTGVLHSVGNVLNSVNVSAAVIESQIRRSSLTKLELVADLISEHKDDFGKFVNEDARGRKIPHFISKVTDALREEHFKFTNEFEDLLDNVEHIKEIVAVQQGLAKSRGLYQTVNAKDLIDRALVANKGKIRNYQVRTKVNVAEGVTEFVSDKRKILQILINLITNAKDALFESKATNPQIVVSVTQSNECITIEVADNGPGIPCKDLNRIFQHGFTTKEMGHGFGLHSSANAATELGGSLVAKSDGPGKGAVFQLTLPLNPDSSERSGHPPRVLCEEVASC